MRLRRLVKDSWGNASFAFAAVFILVSVTFLSAIVIQNEKSNRELTLASREAEMAERLPQMLVSEIELMLQAATIDVMNSLDRPFDLSHFEAELRESAKRYFNESYPTTIDQFTVVAKLLNITTSLITYFDRDEEQTPVPGSIFVSMSFEAKISSEHVSFSTCLDIAREIYTPVPYFTNRLEYLSDSSGVEGRLGRIVRAILSELVQLRVLQGYASPGHREGFGIDELLTVDDIELAVNFALLLMQQSIFGTADPLSWEALLSRASSQDKLSSDFLSELLSDEVDPFRAYLLLRNGEISSAISLQDFAAQILYSLIDQLVLRYLEYAHLIDIADLPAYVIDHINSGWRHLLEFLTGVDTELQRTRKWVDHELSHLGIPDNLWKKMFCSNTDFTLEPNSSFVYIFDAQRTLIPLTIGSREIELDLPEMSIMESDAWGDFSNELGSETFRIGKAVEDICTRLCSKLAEKIPPIHIVSSEEDVPLVHGLLDSIVLSLESLPENSLLLEDAIPNVCIYDETLISLKRFIDDSWESIFPFNETVEAGEKLLAEQLAETAVTNDPSNLPSNWKQEVAAVILKEFHGGSMSDWKCRLESSIEMLSEDCKAILMHLLGRQLDDPINEDSSTLDSLVSWFADNTPYKLMLSALRSKSVALQNQIANLTREFFLDERIDIENDREIELRNIMATLAGADGTSCLVIAPEVSQHPAYLEAFEVSPNVHYSIENVDPSNRVCVCIFSPTWDSKSRPKSVHYTSLVKTTHFPYETNWIVRIRGIAQLKVWDLFDGRAAADNALLIDLEIPLTALSGWPLEKVEYVTSNTLLGDAYDLLLEVKNRIWRYLSPLIEAYHRALGALLNTLSGLSKYILGFVERLSKLLLDFGNKIASKCAEIIDWIRSSPLWDLIEVGIDLLGKVEVTFAYGPATIIVSCSLPDLLFKKAKDLIRIIVITKLSGMSIAVGFRIAKLSDGSIDIIANSTVRCKLIRLDMRVDPLMRIRCHLLDINLRWKGFRLDIWSPELDDSRRIGVQLSDLPGIGSVLSSIPVPALGISISLDAGLYMSYRLPLCDQLVINEVEQNPKGRDAGNEWVELYNPLARPLSVDGFTLETVHGKIAVVELSGSVPSRGYKVFAFPKLSLDNGDPSDSFVQGDSIVLRGAGGKVIDITPWISDNSNDARTWHRNWDGGPKWQFGSSTKGSSNGNPLIQTYPDLLLKLCIDSLYLALKKEMDNVSASLEFVRNILLSFFRELLGQIAEFVASLVHEIVFFIDVGLNDLSSSVGTGFRLKVTLTGDLVRQGILWISEQLIRLFGFALLHRTITPDLLGDSHPAEAIHIGFDSYSRVGFPRMLRPLFNPLDIPTEIRLAFSFSINLAAIGAIFGKSWGDWCLIFGVHIDDLPGKSLVTPLFMNREKVDLWLIRGRLYPS